MKKNLISALALACAAAFVPAQAAVTLIAKTTLDPNGADLSGLNYTLENGQPANLLGGLGSGLAWAGGNTFVSVPDRGPNATVWNVDLDNTTSWVPRFHTLALSLSNTADGNLPMTLAAQLTGTTLLYSRDALVYGPAVPPDNTKKRHYFSGRSDNFDAATDSLSALDARF